MIWNWMFRHILFGPLLRKIRPVEIVGRQNLPKRGPFILAFGSHTTEGESAYVSAWLVWLKIQFYAKAEYWNRGRVIAWFMTKTAQIPIDRRDRRAANIMISKGAKVLDGKKILGIYPEGTRSKDGKVHRGKLGVVRTVLRAHKKTTPIIPVGLIGMVELTDAKGILRDIFSTKKAIQKRYGGTDCYW